MPALGLESSGLYHDDGVYLVTAKALAQGDGYTIGSLPGAVPQTKYPFLFPLALSAVWRITPDFPANLRWLRLVPFGATLMWMVWVYALFRHERVRAPVAAGVLALALASPSVLMLSTLLLSGTLFAALAWSALLALRKLEDGGANHLLTLTAALLTAGAILTRTLGIALPAAAVLSLLLRRRRAEAARYSLYVALLVTPWFVWAHLHQAQVPAWTGYYATSTYANWNLLTNFALTEKLRVVGLNGLFLLMTPAALAGDLLQVRWGWQILAGVLPVVGFLGSLRRGANVTHAFVVFYIVMLLLWPWPPARFVVPLYPLVLLYAWEGVRGILHATQLAARPVLLISTATVLVFAYGTTRALAKATGSAAENGTVFCRDDWAEYAGVTTWLAEHTAPGHVLMGNIDPLLHLYTGRRAVRAQSLNPVLGAYSFDPAREPLGPMTALVSHILETRADYLVLTPDSCFLEAPFLRRQVTQVLDTYPGALTEQYRISPKTVVYRIHRPALAAAGRVPPSRP